MSNMIYRLSRPSPNSVISPKREGRAVSRRAGNPIYEHQKRDLVLCACLLRDVVDGAGLAEPLEDAVLARQASGCGEPSSDFPAEGYYASAWGAAMLHHRGHSEYRFRGTGRHSYRGKRTAALGRTSPFR